MSIIINRTGERYGRLVVLERAKDQVFSSRRKVVRWRCLCDCGNITEVATTSLGSGLTKSCGCWNDEQIHKSETKFHNADKNLDPQLYERWRIIKRRCYEKTNEHYKYYGARGIVMCDEWKNDFKSFRLWCYNNGYDASLTIDRIDVNGNYEPNNCRRTTTKIQQNNKRNNTIYSLNEKSHTLSEWSDITGINRGTISSRIKNGWTVERALTTPVKK